MWISLADCPSLVCFMIALKISTLKFETDSGYIMDCPWQDAKVWVALCFHFEIWDRLGLHYGLPLAGCQSLGCFMFPLWNLRQTRVTLWIALGRVPKFGLLYVSTLKFETDSGYIMDCPWQGAKVWSALCFYFEIWDRLGLHYGLPLAGCQMSKRPGIFLCQRLQEWRRLKVRNWNCTVSLCVIYHVSRYLLYLLF